MTAIPMALVLAPAATILAIAGLAARTGPPIPAIGATTSGWVLAGRTMRWIGSVSWLARLARRDRVEARLEAAGSTRAAEVVVGLKWTLAAAAIALGLGTTASPLWVALAVGAFMAPDLSLVRASRARLMEAQRELPLLLDVVAAAVGAGLTGQLAVRRAAGAIEGPLADELLGAFRRVDLGGRWGDELDAVAERLALPDLQRANAVLKRGDAMGSPLAEGLAEIARESREARRASMTERARKAPVKMLFPLVFLILPAFLLLTVVPVLVTTLRSIR